MDPDLLAVVRKYALNLDDVNDTLKYLHDLKDGEGYSYSQSLKQYDKLIESFNKFKMKDHSSFRWNRNYQKALELVKLRFSKKKLKPLSYMCDDDILDALPKVNTHSGYSWIETGKKKKGEYKGELLKHYLEVEEAARMNGSFQRPILPGTRTQGSGAFTDDGQRTNTCKHKTRLISMVDLYQIIAELKFAKPIQDVMASDSWYAGGFDQTEIGRRITGMRAKWHWYISLDYSSYDQSISSWLIEDAFSCLKEAFVSVDDELWNIIVGDFIHKNFVTPFDLDGGIVHSDKGVPSGSMFTQIIDTVVNWIMILTYLISQGFDGDMIVMGDDNLLFTNAKVEIEAISSYISKNFGVKVNADKTQCGDASQTPEFLSCSWTYDGAFRHPRILLSKMAYPERKRVYKGEVTPEMVLFGYYLTYPAGVRKLIDVDRFLRDYNYSKQDVLLRVDSRYIPGAFKYNMEYLSKSA